MNESDVEAAMQAATAFRMQNARGAVGSTEAPPNPWTGISGPAGALDLIWNSALPEISDAQWRLWNSAKCAEIESLTFERDSAVEYIKTQEARIAALEADTAALNKALAMSVRLHNAAFMAFIADPPDLPDPPRRPDGTLMPQPKALTLPRETGDKRRIGG